MGRTGKKNPRLAEDFLIWANEETIIKIILNTYKYVDKYIDRSLAKNILDILWIEQDLWNLKMGIR